MQKRGAVLTRKTQVGLAQVFDVGFATALLHVGLRS